MPILPPEAKLQSRTNSEHSIVVAIGDVKLAGRRVDRDAVGARELALRRVATHACGAVLSSAGDAGDLT